MSSHDELAQIKDQLAKIKDRNADLETEVISLRRALKQAESRLKSATVSRPPKPPLDPDSEAARQINALKTANRNLRRKLAETLKWHEEQMRRHGGIPLELHRTFIKYLHPDGKPPEPERDHLCKLYNDWHDSHKK